MARLVSEGQRQAALTSLAKERSDSAAVTTQQDLPSYIRSDFRIFLIRPDQADVRIDHMVENLSWTEPQDSLVESGSLALIEPAYREGKIKIWAGHQIRLEWTPERDGSYEELWRMRVYEPELALESWARTVQLKNDASLLEISVDDFDFTSSKKHKKGFLNKEVIHHVCEQYGIGVVSEVDFSSKFVVAAGSTDSTAAGSGWYSNQSPLDMIVEAMKSEMRQTDKRFVARMRGNTLTIRNIKTTKEAYKIGPSLVSAALTQTLREDFATALTVYGARAAKKGKDKRKHVVAKVTDNTAHINDHVLPDPTLDTHPTPSGRQ